MAKQNDPFTLYGVDPMMSACQDMLALPMAMSMAWWNLATGWIRPAEVRNTVEPGPIQVPEPIEKKDERGLFA